jgi:hypothetical protein
MNKHKLITTMLLMLPGLSWGGETPTVTAPEPGMLALLAAGGVVAGVAAVIRRKK